MSVISLSPHAYQEEDLIAFLLQLRARGFSHQALLRAMESFPRTHFMPHAFRDLAFRNMAIPLAAGRTLSEPFLMARCLELLHLEVHHRVLEIGTGAGYGTALLSHLCQEVVSCEDSQSLALEAQKRLQALGVSKVQIFVRDEEGDIQLEGLFDRIFIHRAVDHIPDSLLSYLAEGGIILYGEITSLPHPQIRLKQRLYAENGTWEEHDRGSCCFSPLLSKNQDFSRGRLCS